MLVSFALPNANFMRHLTQNPQRKSVEYRLRWVPNAKFSRWPSTFNFFGVDFICVGFRFFASATQTLPDTKAVLSGIWALGAEFHRKIILITM